MPASHAAATIVHYGAGICAVDADYLRPGLAAIHILCENGRAAIVDSGTAHSVPHVLAALAQLDIAPEAVDYLILTHVHLDHAGGAGALLRELPNATLTVHPRGARHMADPAKLWAGTVAVYGENEARALYGELLPVPPVRIRETAEGARLSLAGRTLSFYETPGHARHHVAIHDEGSGHVFAGDTFGISYRELDMADAQFVFLTTSPVQFDPKAYHRSLDRIAALAADAVYVTHFGQLRAPRDKLARLHALVDAHATLALGAPAEQRMHHLVEGIRCLLLSEVRHFGSVLAEEEVLRVYGGDVLLNAQGLDVWLRERPFSD